jgi:hypothetical protein
MIITAKFPSTCPKCSKPIAVGSKVEWNKGEKASHVDCSAVSADAPAAAPRTEGTCGKCGGPCKPGFATCYKCFGADKKCRVCGTVERRNARGFLVGDWVRNGECQSCREERKMGY